jgi:guanosine-3',5'-bis(diphosphate) 3'-pyrophosphohydrolase
MCPGTISRDAIMTISEDELKLLLQALAFSAHKHKDQRRKDVDASPYINHPISLASILCNEGHVTDIHVICGALLHDTVEDTDTTARELEEKFGPEIRDIVMDVTDDKTLDKGDRKRLQIEHAAHISDQAKLVKLADKISNLRDVAENPPPAWSLERCQGYFDWAKEVIDQLRGTHESLEAIFDKAYANRPNGSQQV